jgi:23S rRNA (cytosine1962-C5)-methyltransferase
VELINDALSATSTNGVIFFSTNFSKFVIENELINAGEIKDITKATTPFDFEGKLKRWCYRITK